MKRRMLALLMMLCMISNGAMASQVFTAEEYTDVPAVMTQDAVISAEADQDCEVMLLQPDEKSTALLEDVYDFVWREKNRPVRYYDEPTQQKIQELVPETDIDVLHMTEFMAQVMVGEPLEKVRIERLMDVDYRPGQLIVIVLGVEQENGEYKWFPYRGEVPEQGRIVYEIPKEDFEQLVGQQVIYHVLTNRVGARGESDRHTEVVPEQTALPSKSADDISRINSWYSSSGEPINDDFRIFLVDKTREIEQEIERIGEHLLEEKPAINYFPEERRDEAQLLLQDVDVESLVIYDVEAVMSEDYIQTYDDVAVESRFTAAYKPHKKMVAMLGFPLENVEEQPYMDWYCLRTEALEDTEELVEIVFKQLVIPEMEIQPAMLVLLSEPIQDVEEPEATEED